MEHPFSFFLYGVVKKDKGHYIICVVTCSFYACRMTFSSSLWQEQVFHIDSKTESGKGRCSFNPQVNTVSVMLSRCLLHSHLIILPPENPGQTTVRLIRAISCIIEVNVFLSQVGSPSFDLRCIGSLVTWLKATLCTLRSVFWHLSMAMSAAPSEMPRREPAGWNNWKGQEGKYCSK